MGGMEMMLKALGIDPNELKQYASNVQQLVKNIDDRLARIEAALYIQKPEKIENGKAEENRTEQ